MAQSDPPPVRPARFDSLQQQVFLNLWRTYDRLRMFEDELLGRFNLTPQQYNVLRLLQAHRTEGLQTLQLAGRLVSRAPDITRMVDKLEERGLVERLRRAENRRVVEVRITAEGIRLVQRIAGPLQECHTRQLGHMTAEDLERLSDLLCKARQPHEDDASHWRE